MKFGARFFPPLFLTLALITVCGSAIARPAGENPKPAPRTEDLHAPSIEGLRLGMNAHQVLETLGRMPDKREDKDGQVIVYWKVGKNDVLMARFRGDFIYSLNLRYRPVKPLGDFWLEPNGTERAGDDTRMHREYKITQTDDRERLVWTREEKSPSGYRFNLSFISPSKSKAGAESENHIEFKTIAVRKEDLKIFDSVSQSTILRK